MKARPIVMLIDDHDISLFVAQHIIKESNKKVDTILLPSGFSALKYLSENQNKVELIPDVILIDFDMPVVNGKQFIEQFEALSKTLKTVPKMYILSGFDKKEIFINDINSGVVSGYIKKPLTLEKFSKIMN
ncbi:MAG: response regulator [Bacteroidota bacterium]|nr:response regulator [Bacteroidota bacterium]